MSSIMARFQQYGISRLSLCADSRAICPGDTFVALPGLAHDGRLSIEAAIQKGASAVLYETTGFSWTSLERCPKVGVFALSSYLHEIKNCFVQNMDAFTLIGITGTNGKTSIAWFLSQASEQLEIPSTYMGTLGQGRIDALKPTANTTPDIFTIYRLLQQWEKEAIERVIMEVSSHALAQRRVDGLRFKVAIFTNLSRDHLDYHHTMNRYLQAKMELAYLADSVLVYGEDPYFQPLMRKSWAMTYGFSPSFDFYAKHYVQDQHGISMHIISPFGRTRIQAPLIGHFNAANLLATAATLFLLGHQGDEIAAALAKIQPPPGRLQGIHIAGKPKVFVDYAHTPDALARVLQTLRRTTPGKLYVVFGCGGNRDRGKRAPMGAIAETLADQVILTSDNPRDEDPNEIIGDILAGMRTMPGIILNREKAIIHTIQSAKAADTVLIAGKGHEKVQIMASTIKPFDDVAIAKEALQC